MFFIRQPRGHRLREGPTIIGFERWEVFEEVVDQEAVDGVIVVDGFYKWCIMRSFQHLVSNKVVRMCISVFSASVLYLGFFLESL